MIVKFHARGAGRGSGPVDYLLGQDRSRAGATLDRGDPDEIQALIDSSPYAKKYTSGVLSFSEPDLPREIKDKIMADFEKALVPGLDSDQYSCLWVEHRDKERLELNFVIPNIELHSGKRLQPYYDRADKPRINAWKIGVNAAYDLHDPDDPMNKRELVTPRDLPAAKQDAARAITDGLLSMAASGEVSDRKTLVSALSGAGFEVVRQTKKSVSIADPDGGRNIRLKGAIYEQDFGFGERLRAEIEAASERYRAESQERIRAAREVYQRGVEIKRAENQRRYKRPECDFQAFSAQVVALGDRECDSRSERIVGRDILPRHADSRELAENQRTEGRFEADRGQNMGARACGRGQRTLHSDTQGLHRENRLVSREERINQAGEEVNDRAGAAIIERIRAVTERTRAAAKEVCRSLRELSLYVRVHEAGERRATPISDVIRRSGAELERASERIEQQNRREQTVNRGMSR